MVVGRTWTGALVGVESIPVRVEVDVGRGLPTFTIVGLPDAAVQESRERIRSAVLNCGMDFPVSRLTANLAPADVRKEGPASDLAVALAILAATGQVPARRLDDIACFGELSLEGEVRPVAGMLSHALGLGAAGARELLVPVANAEEAALATDVAARPVRTLAEAVRHVRGEVELPAAETRLPALDERGSGNVRHEGASGGATAAGRPDDLADVKGQSAAKRALEIAAAGGHNVLMVGPPGSGKTMLARRLAGILPSMARDEALEVVRLHSVAGLSGSPVVRLGLRPFRSPHHTVSVAGLVGGGSPLRPGEVSLAHQGVLFLDEIAEFGKAALQVLRQPLEEGSVTLARASRTIRFPARFMLVAAMNPCPCGFFGDARRTCSCSAAEITRYRAKLSGPLIDRIDMMVQMRRLTCEELTGDAPAESSAAVGARVWAARRRQRERLGESGICCNAGLTSCQLRSVCAPDSEARRFLELAVERLGLSGRGYDRVLRMARTIADLRGSEDVEAGDVAEAVQYRALPGVR